MIHLFQHVGGMTVVQVLLDELGAGRSQLVQLSPVQAPAYLSTPCGGYGTCLLSACNSLFSCTGISKSTSGTVLVLSIQ